jgi:hypothetical protein
MKYRFARPYIIFLYFALMVCQSKTSVHDDLMGGSLIGQLERK